MKPSKEDYEQLINSKKYWNYLSYEFKTQSADAKLINIAEYLKMGGNLHDLIRKYKQCKNIDNRNQVKPTIEKYLKIISKEQNLFFIKQFSESQLITILSRELESRLYEDYDLNTKSVHSKIMYGNFNPCLNLVEDKETLFYDNPWLDLVEDIEDNLYNPLDENVHIEDKKFIDEFNCSVADEYFYHLEILPEPFWGNVLDAKIAILTLNPGYIDSKNRIAFENLSEENKIQFIKNQCETLSLKSKEFIPSYNDRNNISDYYWDKKTHKLREQYKNANSKIALIQFMGYTSFKFKDLPKKITRKIYHLEDDLLYTQKYTVRLVNYLMQEKRVIIIARGSTLWFKAVKDLKGYENLIILDNYRNTSITPNNCKKSGKWDLITKALND